MEAASLTFEYKEDFSVFLDERLAILSIPSLLAIGSWLFLTFRKESREKSGFGGFACTYASPWKSHGTWLSWGFYGENSHFNPLMDQSIGIRGPKTTRKGVHRAKVSPKVIKCSKRSIYRSKSLLFDILSLLDSLFDVQDEMIGSFAQARAVLTGITHDPLMPKGHCPMRLIPTAI